MTHAVFPLAYANDDLRLLTAIFLGMLFGFSLERGGFGNARKLAAQFYLYDMAVFKVMFTAILVAMVGLYTLVNLGLMDLDALFINPTFMWAQVVGGFLMGTGFLMSGLCPGTSVVSAASGRWDGLMAFLGITFGAGAFIVLVDWFPALESLYNSGSMGVSLLHDVFGLPPLVLALAIILIAGMAFVGAEKVERVFRKQYGVVELTHQDGPTGKFILAGGVAVVALIALVAPRAPQAAPPLQMAALTPLDLARDLVEGQPGIMILDLRDGSDNLPRVPRSYPASDPETALRLLATAPTGSTIVVVDQDGSATTVPEGWRTDLKYVYVKDGFLGWQAQVLTPAAPGSTLARREWAAWQNQLSGFFTGAAVEASGAPPPPPMASGGAKKKKKKKGGGC